MTYVDGFVFVVPKKNIKAYKKMAMLGKKVWMEHGALDYKECAMDDPNANGMRTFPVLLKAKADEKVFFSFIVFKSKSHRKAVNAKVMKDSRMSPETMAAQPIPFDMRKMTYGGFEVIV